MLPKLGGHTKERDFCEKSPRAWRPRGAGLGRGRWREVVQLHVTSRRVPFLGLKMRNWGGIGGERQSFRAQDGTGTPASDPASCICDGRGDSRPKEAMIWSKNFSWIFSAGD